MYGHPSQNIVLGTPRHADKVLCSTIARFQCADTETMCILERSRCSCGSGRKRSVREQCRRRRRLRRILCRRRWLFDPGDLSCYGEARQTTARSAGSRPRLFLGRKRARVGTNTAAFHMLGSWILHLRVMRDTGLAGPGSSFHWRCSC